MKLVVVLLLRCAVPAKSSFEFYKASNDSMYKLVGCGSNFW